MDIRCGSCSKLFRVSDDKITGTGIRFKCSKCGGTVKITREEFDTYKLATATADILTMPESKPKPSPSAPAPAPDAAKKTVPLQPQPTAPAAPPSFDFGDAAPAGPSIEEAFTAPDFAAELSSVPEPAPAPQPKPEPQPTPKPVPQPEVKPEPKVEVKIEPKPELKPEPKPVTVSQPKPGPEIKPEPVLAAAPAPVPAEPAKPAPKPVAAPARPSKPMTVERPAPVISSAPKRVAADMVHPIASGATTGSLAGLGCALPVAMLLFLAIGIVSKFVPLLASMPLMNLIILSVTGFLGVGALIGMSVAVVQALAGKKLFFLLNMLLAAVFGAIIGIVHNSAVSLALGSGINGGTIVTGIVNGGIYGVLIGISLVIVRRLMLSTREETFSANLPVMAVLGMVCATAVFGYTVFGEVSFVKKVQVSAEKAADDFKNMTSIEGLQVQNASGYIDTATNDLVLAGVVENATDQERPAWYLIADVYDAQGGVLIKAKMVNGKQLYSGRDYEILAKRGVNVQELRAKGLQDQGAIIPPRGMVNFEIRILEPPVGIASFNVSLQQFDPVQIFKEMADEMKEARQ